MSLRDLRRCAGSEDVDHPVIHPSDAGGTPPVPQAQSWEVRIQEWVGPAPVTGEFRVMEIQPDRYCVQGQHRVPCGICSGHLPIPDECLPGVSDVEAEVPRRGGN